MIARLERTLIRLAHQHAPNLIPANWEHRPADEWVGTLARQLASYNLLVLTGYTPKLPPVEQAGHIQNWVNEYAAFYRLLAGSLFPSLATLTARYADDASPPIVILEGDATPVMHVLAGYVSPYLSIRQSFPYISEVELLGLMDMILEELEAQDLPRETYNMLRSEGMAILTRLLAVPIHQIRVTPFDKPIFEKLKRPEAQPNMPPPPRPGTLPETGQLRTPAPALKPKPEPPPIPPVPPESKTKESESAEDSSTRLPPLPVFKRNTSNPSKRRLPIPDLPEDSSDES